MTSWPSGLRRCVKVAVFWAWVQIPPKSLLCTRCRLLAFYPTPSHAFVIKRHQCQKQLACCVCFSLFCSSHSFSTKKSSSNVCNNYLAAAGSYINVAGREG